MSDPNWKIADEFDRKLFSLKEQAEVNAGGCRHMDERCWADVAAYLRQARRRVRAMMREEDREQTS